MASGIPGCARAISGRGTGLTPGPGSMPSTGTNHGWRIAEGPKWGDRAARKRHGRGELSTIFLVCDRGLLQGTTVGDGSGVRWEEV